MSQFKDWNECSVSHLLIINSGYNGLDNKNLASNLINMYKRYLLKTGNPVHWAKVNLWQSTFKLPSETLPYNNFINMK